MANYFIYHYVVLMLFVMSFWGIGELLVRPLSAVKHLGDMKHPIIIALGLGFSISVIQLVAILGYLNVNSLLLIFSAGVISSCIHVFFFIRDNSKRREAINNIKAVFGSRKFYLVAIILCLLPTLIRPLGLPVAWDELMYHLPHAQQWILSGKLTANEWIRYPWFPYNYELIYAASMIMVDDIAPHLLHALAGWLVAIIVYKIAKPHFGTFNALVAVLIWLQLSKSYYGNAYIDMGLTLFIVCATTVFYSWTENTKHHALLYISAFFMGLAAGTKYQALMFLPIFFFILMAKRVSLDVFVKVSIIFLLPCAYWYLRNFLVTGDPFAPMGGKIFGFYDWNAEDFRLQFVDLDHVKSWPEWLLWAALFSLLNKKIYSNSKMKSLLIFTSYSVGIWMLISHYPRYLLPVYPFLAVFSAAGFAFIAMIFYQNVTRIINGTINTDENTKNRHIKIASSAVLVLFIVNALPGIKSALKSVAWNDEKRQAILNKRITGYEVLQYQNEHAIGNTYQFGMEYAIYYAKNQTWGDHFGPGRYRDFASLSSKDLHQKLLDMKFENLMVNESVFKDITTKEEFSCYFSETFRRDPVVLYKIKLSRQC